MRNANAGVLKIYNIHNDQIVSAHAMGAIGPEWSLVGIGDFSGNLGETHMLTRNANNGAFEIYDINHDSVVSASSIGAVRTDWQAVGIAPYLPAAAAASAATTGSAQGLDGSSSAPLDNSRAQWFSGYLGNNADSGLGAWAAPASAAQVAGSSFEGGNAAAVTPLSEALQLHA